jgi:hypothetical protein
LCIRSWPKLKDLRLNVTQLDTKPADWAELGRLCPALSKIYLESVTNLTDACLTELAISATNLKELFIPNASHVTELSLVPLLKNNPKIILLSIAGEKLTGEGFISMAKVLTNCQFLLLKTSSAITNDQVVEATAFLRRLQKYCVSACMSCHTSRILTIIYHQQIRAWRTQIFITSSSGHNSNELSILEGLRCTNEKWLDCRLFGRARIDSLPCPRAC